MAEDSTSTRRASISRNFSETYVRFFGLRGVRDDMQRINSLFLPFIATATLAAVWVGWKANAVGPVLLWAFSSFAAGGTAGFLFGIPKSGISGKLEAARAVGGDAETQPTAVASLSSARDTSQRARPNTNLEEVSDWVTKILVGLTLVNLKELKSEVASIGMNAAAAINPKPNAAEISTATALIVGFALVGFLAAYLYMRLFVQGAMVRSDDQMNQYRNAIERAERIVADEQPESASNQEAAVAVMPSAASLSAAQEVANVAPANSPELVLQPLRQLASEYEGIRQVADYSKDRTKQMTEVVRRMRPYAIAAAPYIKELMQSPSTGDHLAAAIIMQMKYVPEHMQWLTRRLVEERAFIGYQAASALLARVRLAGVPEAKEIQAAVKRAADERAALQVSESTLDDLIKQILSAR